MKIKQLISAVALTAIALTGTTSCSPGGKGEPENPLYQQFATLVSANTEGCVLETQNSMYGPVRTLTANRTISSEKVKPGERLIIVYELPYGESNENSGPIDLKAYRPVVNGVLETVVDVQALPKYGMQDPGITITGKWLNVMFMGAYRTEPKNVRLVIDDDQLGVSDPSVYLLYEPDQYADATYQPVYASFDISDLYKGGYKSFTIKMNNETGPQSVEVKLTESIQPM